ncbi:gliding motility lipoprotein GldH [Solitalea canadensis]|uniref:Gliding motility-associated lipoprotein GldH n=1 Tax=Solitalea canadensis (strain ATCC 29591 / DSM 3403 / JCM 21819 / LMG 8368 / NBRC 15130 / NCIMB 12057 / USAM 9D) TaxID=929556 RepID=H8KL39_SOLCM|nr:gliding motility lipoprotein GldH [Solitalea canadensis]AFD09122.1 gliding motility-associated lipoprotein GldH [Solitalea canadensis DSM 3403]
MFRSTRLFSKLFLFSLSCTLLMACTDNSVYNNTTTISDKGWFSNDKAVFDVKIDNPGKLAVYLDLRHTDDYKYSNLFLRMYVKNPDGKMQPTRVLEVKLAEKDGKWRGSGSGKLISQETYITNALDFSKPGSYRIEFEQFMRDDPLKEISDLGVKLIKE